MRRLADKELEKVASHRLIHLTTTGRKTRNPHIVELWFVLRNDKVYLSHEGSKTDWMKNIQNNDEVSFAINGKHFGGRARMLEKGTQEAWQAKVALYEKYYGKAADEIIEDWFSLSQLIAVEPFQGTCVRMKITHPVGSNLNAHTKKPTHKTIMLFLMASCSSIYCGFHEWSAGARNSRVT